MMAEAQITEVKSLLFISTSPQMSGELPVRLCLAERTDDEARHSPSLSCKRADYEACGRTSRFALDRDTLLHSLCRCTANQTHITLAIAIGCIDAEGASRVPLSSPFERIVFTRLQSPSSFLMNLTSGNFDCYDLGCFITDPIHLFKEYLTSSYVTTDDDFCHYQTRRRSRRQHRKHHPA